MNEDFVWFNKQFIGLCLDNNIEPILTGDKQLKLICPRTPTSDVLNKITSNIPEEQDFEVIESMRTDTPLKINMILKMSGAQGCSISENPKTHEVTVNVQADMLKIEHFRPDSPFWNEVAHLLKEDSYIESFLIKCNDNLVRDSKVFNPNEGESILGSIKKEMETMKSDNPNDILQDIRGMVKKETVKSSEKTSSNSPTIKDDRFSDDRDFLPKDIGTDVKILLETCNSIDDFIKQI